MLNTFELLVSTYFFFISPLFLDFICFYYEKFTYSSTRIIHHITCNTHCGYQLHATIIFKKVLENWYSMPWIVQKIHGRLNLGSCTPSRGNPGDGEGKLVPARSALSSPKTLRSIDRTTKHSALTSVPDFRLRSATPSLNVLYFGASTTTLRFNPEWRRSLAVVLEHDVFEMTHRASERENKASRPQGVAFAKQR